MTGDGHRGQNNAVVYIDRSEIREGKADELRAGVRKLVDFVDAHEPQLIAYAFHVDEKAGEMTVIAVHPDSASLELHVEVAGGEFRKLAHLLPRLLDRRLQRPIQNQSKRTILPMLQQQYHRPKEVRIEHLRRRNQQLAGKGFQSPRIVPKVPP